MIGSVSFFEGEYCRPGGRAFFRKNLDVDGKLWYYTK